jgi:hypothetical protein
MAGDFRHIDFLLYPPPRALRQPNFEVIGDSIER